jgi:nucleotide-binding universal stress UspA family protein
VFLNILVAVDGSAGARKALVEAVDIARAHNSKLTLVSVAPPPATFIAFARATTPEQMQDELARSTERILRRELAWLPDDLVAQTVQRSGHAREEIVSELERGGYDLIVLGGDGLGRPRRSLLGSVGGYVRRRSETAILSLPAAHGMDRD